MWIRAYWQFYKEIFPFILAFSAIAVSLFGVLWGFVLCVTFGMIFGTIGFYAFKREQFYFYHNLGLTPWSLVKVAFVLNGLVSLLIFFLLQLLFVLIRGSI